MCGRGNAAGVVHLRGVREHGVGDLHGREAGGFGATDAVVGSLCKRQSSGKLITCRYLRAGSVRFVGIVTQARYFLPRCDQAEGCSPMLLETSGPTPSMLRGTVWEVLQRDQPVTQLMLQTIAYVFAFGVKGSAGS